MVSSFLLQDIPRHDRLFEVREALKRALLPSFHAYISAYIANKSASGGPLGGPCGGLARLRRTTRLTSPVAVTATDAGPLVNALGWTLNVPFWSRFGACKKTGISRCLTQLADAIRNPYRARICSAAGENLVRCCFLKRCLTDIPSTPPLCRWPALITLPSLAKFQLVWRHLCDFVLFPSCLVEDTLTAACVLPQY